jgi:signal transduction histidine kinase
VKDLGIGVGLSCSKELCEALGGNVRLVSSKKGCTLFEMRVPINNH